MIVSIQRNKRPVANDGTNKHIQVCVEPRTSALNMTLPAAAARAHAAIGTRRSSCRSISAARARAQQQTSRTALSLSIDGTDRRRSGQTPYRYIDTNRIVHRQRRVKGRFHFARETEQLALRGPQKIIIPKYRTSLTHERRWRLDQ